MGMVLGLDGKKRAVQINTGETVSAIGTVYLGLLSTLPANPEDLTLAALLTGNEFAASGSWYSGGRLALPMVGTTVDANGAKNGNSTVVGWSNTSGSTKNVAGAFLTNVQSGTSGLVLAVGNPNIGTAAIPTGESIQIPINGLLVKVN